jgi:RNA polymerase sigma-70 factor (ECF subfamily)
MSMTIDNREAGMPQGDKQPITINREREMDDFERLFNAHENSLYHFIRYLCGEEDLAADIYQETWLRAAKYLSAKKDVANFKAWIYTIAKNIFRDELRKRKINRLLFGHAAIPDEIESDGLSHFQHLVPQTDQARQFEIREAIEKAMASLSPRQKTIFILFYIEGFKITEICEMMTAAEGTVKSTLHRTVLKIRKEIGEMDQF